VDKSIAPAYIRARFEPSDRVAVVLIDRKANHTTQRIMTAERASSPEFQAWLRYENAQKRDVYVSMNPLRPDAHGRHKEDIASIRHVYLDFDQDGAERLRAMLTRRDVPQPHAIVATSPGKFQTVWRVDGFSQSQAEKLMRGMTRELGADVAATDASRVLRLPGFNNWKYDPPHFVTAQQRPGRAFTPADFPAFPEREIARNDGIKLSRATGQGPSQSHRDWAWTLEQLEHGVSPERVRAELESRRPDKPNPAYYARHTVDEALKRGFSRSAGMER
jgi:hypothetical protein